MHDFWKNLLSLFRSPPSDPSLPDSQANSFREVIALQAILVTLVVALLAYIQKEPTYQLTTDVIFALLAGVPIIGLYHIFRGHTKTPQGDVYVYTRPVRAYAQKAFFLALLIVAGLSFLYFEGQLPGQ